MNYKKSEAKDAARAQFRGVWAAIATPFTQEGALDEAGLRHNMRHFTGGLGVAGIFCAGTMGEFWALTKEERKRVVEIVVEEARGKCKVIAHTGHHSPDETVDLTRHAQEVGADFAVVMNPYYPIAGEQAIYEWFKAIVSRVEIGVWMFDTPFSGVEFSPELTARIDTWLVPQIDRGQIAVRLELALRGASGTFRQMLESIREQYDARGFVTPRQRQIIEEAAERAGQPVIEWQ